MSYIKRTWTVENTWQCSSCGYVNKGRELRCGTCGSAKEQDEADTLASPDAPAVTDPKLLEQAAAGPNWVCEFCQGQVRAPDGQCANCAAQPVKLPVPGPGVPLRRDGGGWHPLYAVFAVAPVGGLVWLLLWLFVPREELATVSELKWDRMAQLYKRVQLHGEGWGAPIGSFNDSCERRYYGTESCHPHDCRPHSVSYDCNCVSYECRCHKSCRDNKNGFSTCSESCSTCERCSRCSRTEYDTCYEQCPVYRQWCSYDYYDWPLAQQLTTEGTEHDEHWPALEAVGPEQRLKRRESYAVTFKNPKGAWQLTTDDFAAFQRFQRGAEWRISVTRAGGVTAIGPAHTSAEASKGQAVP